MKKKNILLAALAAVMVLTSAVGAANAYFTTNTAAAGTRTLHVGSNTDIEEEFSQWVKYVRVTNSDTSQPVYVRARAFHGSQYKVSYESELDVGGAAMWTLGSDGYYYYRDILGAGETTQAALKVVIDANSIPEGTESFNVTVVYEASPVQYDSEGNPYQNWNVTLDPMTAQ